MMNSIRKTACALTVLAVSTTSVWATESVELKVVGKIAPSACIPAIAAGGAVDYGVISAGNLSATEYNDLDVKKIDFSITCSAPAKFGIKAVSGRLGSVVSDQLESPEGFAVAPIGLFGGVPGVPAAGLGMTDDGAKIGGYAARLSPFTSQGDSAEVDTIISMDVGKTWVTTANPIFTASQQILSWAQTGTTVPVAMTNLAAELEVNAYLNKASELDLTKVVNLDGLATIEVVYL
ncbi:DUF1120 domain-containing protein [Acinetobacter courvalinii]|uniref:DUF1120 domain-containing protein n=1 Tax=Acinetobacter courvalinii TaxID=280147 RepID=UPI0021D242A2|nr:DUF1120 domain-containing protein [Acinetobacter courvalinii]MCU4369590.1 DUF1120 domain-containing protein [Acinetobacter courvalinii]MCU4447795.1 DUF1120 domain-containing protein [Acinetobacter courvalinii]